MSNHNTFRILSIDGGGVRGIIPARILQSFEEMTNQPISNLFDLIVGTSTGGLIALALSHGNNKKPGFTAKDIVQIYTELSPQIFPRSIWHSIYTGAGLWGAKYSRKGYDKVLENLFKDARLSESLVPIIIPTYSLIQASPNLFCSRKCHEKGIDFYIRDIAGATSAAPTYFPPKIFTDLNGNKYIEVDGGIFANNPEAIAVTEAYALKPDLQRKDIQIISIGTGTPKLKQSHTLTNAGVIGWVMKANLIDLMIDASSTWDIEEIKTLYSMANRIQIPIDGSGEMDDVSSSNIKGLVNVTETYITQNKPFLEKLISSYII